MSGLAGVWNVAQTVCWFLGPEEKIGTGRYGTGQVSIAQSRTGGRCGEAVRPMGRRRGSVLAALLGV